MRCIVLTPNGFSRRLEETLPETNIVYYSEQIVRKTRNNTHIVMVNVLIKTAAVVARPILLIKWRVTGTTSIHKRDAHIIIFQKNISQNISADITVYRQLLIVTNVTTTKPFLSIFNFCVHNRWTTISFFQSEIETLPVNGRQAIRSFRAVSSGVDPLPDVYCIGASSIPNKQTSHSIQRNATPLIVIDNDPFRKFRRNFRKWTKSSESCGAISFKCLIACRNKFSFE